ncbi:MAG: amidohydrolase [Chloroflexota bacterium]
MKADLILYNAHIYTVDSTNPWAEAVACAGGRFVAVGPSQDVLNLAGAHTRRIDAGGRLVLPGLIDAHVHFQQYAIRRHEVNLFGVSDFEEVRRRVRQAVERRAPGEWIQGWGWDENLWAVRPSRVHLDDIAPDNPVVLRRMDMHTYWVNTAALTRAGLSRATPDPPDSRLDRDAAGDLTGMLREWNALRLLDPFIPEPDETTLQGWLEEAIVEAHQLGLTGIHDQRVQRQGRRSLRLFQTLRRQGRLNLRVHLNLAAEHLSEADQLGLQPGFGDDRLWLGHIKVFADGTMGSRTARMIEPFEGEPDNYGLVVTSKEDLRALAQQAGRAGFSLSVHAIGDLAVRHTIDALSEFKPDRGAASGRLPHRIEHVQVIHPDDLPRLAQHGLVASIQPVHLCTDWSTADRVWGARARYAYAFRSLLAHGARLAMGSDAPVAPLNPLLGIYAAVTRRDLHGRPQAGWYPAERLGVAEAVCGYTLGPASLAGHEHLQGSITPGKWADLIVLSHNIFEIPPAEIAATRVELTVFDGQIVYSADHPPAGLYPAIS